MLKCWKMKNMRFLLADLPENPVSQFQHKEANPYFAPFPSSGQHGKGMLLCLPKKWFVEIQVLKPQNIIAII